jgi:hypothetical protein
MIKISIVQDLRRIENRDVRDLVKETNKTLEGLQETGAKIKYARYHPENSSYSICYNDSGIPYETIWKQLKANALRDSQQGLLDEMERLEKSVTGAVE